MTSAELPRPEMTSCDGVSLVNSCSAAVDLREEIPALNEHEISQCHVTASLFDDVMQCDGKTQECEMLKSVSSQTVRVQQEVKKTSKSELMNGGSRQRKIKAAVVVVACLLLLTSFVLVGVTLSMSSHIDDMVRKTYEPPSIQMTTRNQQRHNNNNNNSNHNNNQNNNESLQRLQQLQTTTRQ